MKKFSTWHDQIEEVEVIRETAKYVMLPPYGHRAIRIPRNDPDESDTATIC
jgi:hypothetical protein